MITKSLNSNYSLGVFGVDVRVVVGVLGFVVGVVGGRLVVFVVFVFIVIFDLLSGEMFGVFLGFFGDVVKSFATFTYGGFILMKFIR